ncbi:MAG: hypothetical protein B7Z08_13340 [Sphingomonadales bacterium 32-68-7]|nr:MAG: hypothetical protein B7Z33_04400 [Sphingomonadales bacterium 12-68-11]OYX06902.1 MAG: hypothetical protein B7Z08_13340 [Sphingomonadales bacterium 32-68-7]
MLRAAALKVLLGLPGGRHALMKEALSHFLEHLRGLGGIRATFLSLITGAVIYLTSKVFELYDDAVMASLPFERTALLQVLLAAVVILAVGFIAHEWGRSRLRRAVPEFRDTFYTEIEPIPFRTQPLDSAIQHTLIPTLFPSELNSSGAETMPFEEIDKVGEMNRYTAVGVKAGERIVGYASFWPVRDEVGLKLLAGAMSDSDLVASDALPDSQRRTARYAVIPGFGVVHPKNSIRVRAAVVLYHTLKTLIAREYLKGHKRGSLTVIAFPYSDAGKEWCEKLGFVANGNYVAYADGKSVPVCCRKVTLLDLV